MNRELVISLLGQDWTDFQAIARDALRTDIDLLNATNETVLSNSGKQLRPMLSLLTARACGRLCDDTLHYAATSELLHNATLMHDDVVDESKLRRGKPTVAALLGAGPAVLVGDFWLSRAVRLILGTAHEKEATRLYADVLSDLAEGEMLQLQKASQADTTEEDYLRIIYCKTASLFKTTCVAAALSADASQAYTYAVERYATATGMAFQIRDDIFDYIDGTATGKPAGLDLMEGKITLPLLGALRNAPDAQALREKVLQIPDHPEYCAELHEYVLAHGGVEYASGRLDDFIREATDALEALPDSREREVLADIARYNAIRKS